MHTLIISEILESSDIESVVPATLITLALSSDRE